MKHEKIGDGARVWTVTRGPTGRLQPEIDPRLLAALNPGMSAVEVEEAIARAVGNAEIAASRIW